MVSDVDVDGAVLFGNVQSANEGRKINVRVTSNGDYFFVRIFQQSADFWAERFKGDLLFVDVDSVVT